GYYLDRQIAENFRSGGLYHILVISGSHIALLALVVQWLIGLIIKPRWLRFFLTISILWFYGLLVGSDAPVMRAVVMASFALAALVLARPARPINIFALAALLLLTDHPGALWEASFQLTMVAVAL